MKVKEIICKLKEAHPPCMALPWDNPGLQVGRMDYEIRKIFVALEATGDVIRECIQQQADLLVTHHPLLMSGIKSVSSEDYLGEKALTLAEHKIAHYAMHTNYDVTKMCELAEKALDMREVQILDITGRTAEGKEYGIGSVGELPEEMTARQCCEYVKKAFSLDTVRLFGDSAKMVKRAAICPGSGKSEISAALQADAQVYISGDIGHHDGLDAVDQGLIVIDAGHYGVEHIFIHQMAHYLKQEFPELEVTEAEIRQPFEVI